MPLINTAKQYPILDLAKLELLGISSSQIHSQVFRGQLSGIAGDHAYPQGPVDVFW